MSDGPFIKNTPAAITAEKIAAATKLPAVSTAAPARDEASAKLPSTSAAPFSFLNEMNDAVNKLAKSSPAAEFTPADIAHLEKIRGLLGPDKFGGKDGRFGHDDVRAIATALLETKEVKAQIVTGITTEFLKQADPQINFRRGGEGRERLPVGKRIATNIANDKLQSNWDTYYQQGRNEAFNKIIAELTSGLEKAGQPRPQGAIVHDMTPRNITMADAEALKVSTEAATTKQRAICAKYPEFPVPDSSKVTRESLTDLISQIRAGLRLVKPHK